MSLWSFINGDHKSEYRNYSCSSFLLLKKSITSIFFVSSEQGKKKLIENKQNYVHWKWLTG